MQATGLIGLLVIVAGSFLVWQARKEVVYWAKEFVLIFRRSLARPEDEAVHSRRHLRSAKDQRGALRLVGAISLIFLGHFLVLLDLAF